MVVPMGQPAGTVRGSDAVITGGTIDALCDQIVAGATEPGDVLVIFGATLIVWAVCDEWLTVPGLISYPHTTPDRFVDRRAEQRRRAVRRLGPPAAARRPASGARPREAGPAPRRTGPGPGVAALPPRRAHALRGPLAALEPLRAGHRLGTRGDRAGGLRGEWVRRAAHPRAGRHQGQAHRGQRRRVAGDGLDGRGGRRHRTCRSTLWRCPEGAARGAAYLARMAAGLETSLDDSVRWAGVGRTIEPDPAWAEAAEARYARLRGAGPGHLGVTRGAGRAAQRAGQPLGAKATFSAPLRSWRASALSAGHHSSRAKRWVSIGVMSRRPSATSWR